MRKAYHEELDGFRAELVDMARLVGSAVAAATTALLDADLGVAENVIKADEDIDRLHHDLDERVVDLLARQAPVAGELRTTVAGLRISADLERMGDLARHIAKVARLRYPAAAVPDDLRPTVRTMGEVAERMAAKTADVIASRDTEMALELERDDDEMDRLHRSLFVFMLSQDWPHGVEAAVDITLIGRYYERFADHGVSVADRVVYLVTGERAAEYVG
jgi:phosphate transport system protein